MDMPSAGTPRSRRVAIMSLCCGNVTQAVHRQDMVSEAAEDDLSLEGFLSFGGQPFRLA
jgi:hypothetical protein